MRPNITLQTLSPSMRSNRVRFGNAGRPFAEGRARGSLARVERIPSAPARSLSPSISRRVRAASLLAELKAEYEDANRGFQLREVAGGWRLFTHPAYHEQVESYVLSWDTQRLSQAALETLAVIAYHQPVTRETVKGIRGVNSDGVISSLADKGLIRELGRDPERGQAILYGTTSAFLEKFGLRDAGPSRPRAIRPRRAVSPVHPRTALGRSIQSTLEEEPSRIFRKSATLSMVPMSTNPWPWRGLIGS